MKKRIIAALLAGIMMAGCGQEAVSQSGLIDSETVNVSESVKPFEVSYTENDLNEEWISALSGSSVSIFENVLEEEGEGKNILVSPTSVMMAFGMLENGARGETLSQIETVINGGVPVQQMNPIMYAMAEHFESSEDVKWNVANSVWARNDGTLEIVPEFAQAAKSWYDAEVWMAAFDEGTVRDINGWVNDETRGMIDSIINDISDETVMYLINAMAFEGEWLNEYETEDIIEEFTFTNFDGSSSEVTMLRSTEASYLDFGNGLGFIRPYKGGDYSFVGILPDEGVTVNDFIASLSENGIDFSEAVRNPRYHDADIIVMMPEFSSEYSLEMSDVLKGMGMELPFSRTEADLSGLLRPTGDGDFDIWISKVIHKTFIEVNREGTRAAAVTAIGVDTCSAVPDFTPPMYITLDRPYVYAIVDNATGLPVFLGCVNQL